MRPGLALLAAALCGALAAAAATCRAAADVAPTPTAAEHQHAAPAQGDDATTHHAFDDVTHWSQVFDDPARDAWQKPQAVVSALGLAPGMTVVDLGAGTGYFAKDLSTAVGPRGAVLAADTEPALVAHLRARAEQEGLANLVPILAVVGSEGFLEIAVRDGSARARLAFDTGTTIRVESVAP